MKKETLFCVVLASLFSFYAAAQKEPSEAPPAADSKGTAISVEVVDAREGERDPDVLGNLRSTVGVPKKVRTEGNVPLADLLEKDLKADLESLGYVASASKNAPRRIEVTINTWDCSVYQPGFKVTVRFWYDLDIRVADAKGRKLHEQTLKDVNPERRKLAMKAKPKKVPGLLYEKLRPQILRENKAVLKALKTSEQAAQ